LQRQHIPSALDAKISRGRWRISFCFTHGLDPGWLSPNFEFIEEPIIYWLYRGGLTEES